MTEYETRGTEIRGLAKSLVLQFMQRTPEFKPGKKGLKLAQIFRMCGFDWESILNRALAVLGVVASVVIFILTRGRVRPR